jgi:hypothetical protein
MPTMSVIAELLIGGFFSALGWWSANHYVVEPFLDPNPATMEKKQEKKQEKPDDKPERKDPVLDTQQGP